MNSESQNVVSIFRKEKKSEGLASESVMDKSFTFEDIVERNMKNSERMKKDRLKANKDVARSYRLEPKR